MIQNILPSQQRTPSEEKIEAFGLANHHQILTYLNMHFIS